MSKRWPGLVGGMGLALSIVTTLLLAGTGCHPVTPVADTPPAVVTPELVAVYPAEASEVAEVSDIRVDFNAPIRSADVFSYIGPPLVSGNSLRWECGPNWMCRRWQAAIVGRIVFESGQTLRVKKAWTFTKVPPSPPYGVWLGPPSPVAVTSRTVASYVVAADEPTVVRTAAEAAAPALWQAPAGYLFEVWGRSGGYLQVGAPTVGPGGPAFVGGPAPQEMGRRLPGPYPECPGTGWVAETDVWEFPPLWREGVLAAVVVSPAALYLTANDEDVGVLFLVKGRPTREALDAAVASFAVIQAYITLNQFVAGDSDDDPSSEDIAFLVAERRAWLTAELDALDASTWPEALTAYRDRIRSWGGTCLQAHIALLELMAPALRAGAVVTLTRIRQSTGAAPPDPVAGGDYGWDGMLGDANWRFLEAVQADLAKLMTPWLTPWSWSGE